MSQQISQEASQPNEDSENLASQQLNRYLALPVTVISEPVSAIREDSPGKAKARRAPKCDFKLTAQPVVDGRKQLVALRSLRTALDMAMLSELDGAFHNDSPDTLDEICRDFPQLPELAPVAQAQALFELGQWQHIPLVNEKGQYTGHCASRKRLNELLHGTPRPVRIGGLATPFGVYMTSGQYNSGAGLKGLIATGLLFAVVAHVLDYWLLIVTSALAALFPHMISLKAGMEMTVEIGVVLCSVMVLIRLSPMSGLHAAEHMTINAIESDLPLSPSYIRSQPREHPRCGTNLMVFLGGLELIVMFLSLSGKDLNLLGQLVYAAIGLFLLFRCWQPVGLWLQRHFTTKNPTDAQLESGIKAGLELLEKYRQEPHPYPSLGRRIWGSGMVHMALTFLLSTWLMGWLLELALGGPRH
jgi:hypothetical protein